MRTAFRRNGTCRCLSDSSSAGLVGGYVAALRRRYSLPIPTTDAPSGVTTEGSFNHTEEAMGDESSTTLQSFPNMMSMTLDKFEKRAPERCY